MCACMRLLCKGAGNRLSNLGKNVTIEYSKRHNRRQVLRIAGQDFGRGLDRNSV